MTTKIIVHYLRNGVPMVHRHVLARGHIVADINPFNPATDVEIDEAKYTKERENRKDEMLKVKSGEHPDIISGMEKIKSHHAKLRDKLKKLGVDENLLGYLGI